MTSLLRKMALIEIVDLPIKDGDFPELCQVTRGYKPQEMRCMQCILQETPVIMALLFRKMVISHDFFLGILHVET